ncbi:MAG: hypothetical protein M5U34_24595 [Chloroflexi bacterium]|nr:hypothetical protein [Chloroflexota bacterium]
MASDQDVAETGHTFQENAIFEGRDHAAASGYFTLADDSGLEVDALNGEPGVVYGSLRRPWFRL